MNILITATQKKDAYITQAQLLRYVLGSIQQQKETTMFTLFSKDSGVITPDEKQGGHIAYIHTDLPKRLLLLWLIFILPAKWGWYFCILAWMKLKHNIHTVYCISLGDHVVISLPARMLGMQCVWFADESVLRYTSKRLFYKLYIWLSKSTTLFSYTEFLKNELHITGIDAEVISHVPLAYMPEKKEATYTPSKFTIGTIVYNDNVGINKMLKVIDIVREFIPNIELMIIADRHEKEGIMWLAKRLGIQEYVRVINKDQSSTQWLSTCLVYLVAEDVHKDDILGILEALYYGNIVISPQIGGIDEYVSHKKTGFLLNEVSAETIAQIIITIANKPDWVETMQQHIDNKRKSMISYNEMGARYIKLHI